MKVFLFHGHGSIGSKPVCGICLMAIDDEYEGLRWLNSIKYTGVDPFVWIHGAPIDEAVEYKGTAPTILLHQIGALKNQARITPQHQQFRKGKPVAPTLKDANEIQT